ncbi:MAG: hypothetical protein A2937_02190 [Candidatus Yonathbacteria bacterium RIFCSPLOWO2_01_FULL_47_33b]|uniref:Uncharacterized protein n=1 Tax=Candidatus Yonathbacteria bacterium RIFCSPLOWO2_01_FULL_47_33b TaxID=1802727 RepID=A0A1G2SD66_9BACT|nr:MAG: hypothetical protein A2937_02190 [Candidatus Yonathbacteria bacterium RIFCSPLOWO2_01_FULL_47_33b]
MKKAVHKNVTIDDLAAMVAKGFNSVEERFVGLEKSIDKRFNKVEKEIGEVKEKLEKVEENLNTTRMDVLGIGDKFVSKHEFSQHLVRFSLLEQKVKTRR